MKLLLENFILMESFHVCDRHDSSCQFHFNIQAKNDAKMTGKTAGEDKILFTIGADCTFIIFTEYVSRGI